MVMVMVLQRVEGSRIGRRCKVRVRRALEVRGPTPPTSESELPQALPCRFSTHNEHLTEPLLERLDALTHDGVMCNRSAAASTLPAR
jgi:hypothetical protein